MPEWLASADDKILLRRLQVEDGILKDLRISPPGQVQKNGRLKIGPAMLRFSRGVLRVPGPRCRLRRAAPLAATTAGFAAWFALCAVVAWLAASLPLVFGTNKLSSLCGTSTALWQYARRVKIPWPSVDVATPIG